MFNVVINNEQYDEYLAQKEKIKELEARNEFLKEQYDLLNEKFQANFNHHQGLYEELVQTAHKKDKTLKSLYKEYQRALSDKATLINECDRLTNVTRKQGSDIINLRAKIYDLNADNNGLNAKIKDLDVNAYNSQIVELNNTIEELNEQLTSKDKRIKKYKKTITDNENNLRLKNNRIQELEMTVKDVKTQRNTLKIENDNLKEQHHSKDVQNSKDVQIAFLKSKVDCLSSRLALKETKGIPEIKPGVMYLMPDKDASKLCEWLNCTEERLNALEHYIFGGNKNDLGTEEDENNE